MSTQSLIPCSADKRDLLLVGSQPMAKPNRFDKLKGNALAVSVQTKQPVLEF